MKNFYVEFVPLVGAIEDIPLTTFVSLTDVDDSFGSVSGNARKRLDNNTVKQMFIDKGRGQLEIWRDDIRIERYTLRSHKAYRSPSSVSSSEADHWLHDLRLQYEAFKKELHETV